MLYSQYSIFQPFIMGLYINMYNVKYFQMEFWVEDWEVLIIIIK